VKGEDPEKGVSGMREDPERGDPEGEDVRELREGRPKGGQWCGGAHC
jgi:hypothetical protein